MDWRQPSLFDSTLHQPRWEELPLEVRRRSTHPLPELLINAQRKKGSDPANSNSGALRGGAFALGVIAMLGATFFTVEQRTTVIVQRSGNSCGKPGRTSTPRSRSSTR
jgi:hypothetical protein